mmetsp:Transcript_11762/g.27256  ORF Transcript_11762/g.27256 Transcript_11762/m.27256 type:complete len:355 (-) Transcript_11762:206-1270(-)
MSCGPRCHLYGLGLRARPTPSAHLRRAHACACMFASSRLSKLSPCGNHSPRPGFETNIRAQSRLNPASIGLHDLLLFHELLLVTLRGVLLRGGRGRVRGRGRVLDDGRRLDRLVILLLLLALILDRRGLGLDHTSDHVKLLVVVHVLMHDVLALLVKLDHKEHEDDLDARYNDTVGHHRRGILVDANDLVAKDSVIYPIEDVAHVIGKDGEEVRSGVVVVASGVEHRRHEVASHPNEVEEDATNDHGVISEHEDLKCALDNVNRPVGKALEVVVLLEVIEEVAEPLHACAHGGKQSDHHQEVDDDHSVKAIHLVRLELVDLIDVRHICVAAVIHHSVNVEVTVRDGVNLHHIQD